MVLPALTFTIEEATATGETITNIAECLKQAIAEFVTGARDPQADWDSYLKELDSMGLQEWIATAQAAYDRSK